MRARRDGVESLDEISPPLLRFLGSARFPDYLNIPPGLPASGLDRAERFDTEKATHDPNAAIPLTQVGH